VIDLESILGNSEVLLLNILEELEAIEELWNEFFKVTGAIKTGAPNCIDVKEKAVCVVESSIL
jgi:hypothetical protein